LLHAKLWLADWLVEHDHFALLDNDVPWWLLTHYPEVGDTFTWLDGSLVLAYLLGGGGLLGGLLWLGPAIAARLLKDERLPWQKLSLALTPLAGASVVLGLSMLTITHLKAEHLWLGWVPSFRIVLLTLGCLGALWLSSRLVAQAGAALGRRLAAGLALVWPVGLMAATWITVFFIW
jgi:hypothetical protein